MARADLFDTLSVLFASREDATVQYTNIVYVTAEVYALAFRHSTPRELAKSAFRISKASIDAESRSVEAPNDGHKANAEVEFARTAESRIPSQRNAPRSGLRAALLRERSTLGGARSVLKSARWTNRYSGEFSTTSNQTALVGNKRMWHAIESGEERIASVLTMSSTTQGPDAMLSMALQSNSEILGLLGASGRAKIVTTTRKSALSHTVRTDLQDQGRAELGKITLAMIDESFVHLMSELRERISDFRVRNNVEETWRGRRQFMVLASAGLGFQRELAVLRSGCGEPVAIEPSISQISMERALGPRKDLAVDWKPVEAAIDAESIKLTFEALIEARDDRDRIPELEMASSAIKEMLNFLQCMIMCDQASLGLTSRELALNTLEEVFQNEAFLEAPSLIAKEFDPKCHSFRHLANAVEIAFTFTAALMDNELKQITVMRPRRRKPRTAAKKKQSSLEESADKSKGLLDDRCLHSSERSASEGNECGNDKDACGGTGVTGTSYAADEVEEAKDDQMDVVKFGTDNVQLPLCTDGIDGPGSFGILRAADSSPISPNSLAVSTRERPKPDNVVEDKAGDCNDRCRGGEPSPEGSTWPATNESREGLLNDSESEDETKLEDDCGTVSKPYILPKEDDYGGRTIKSQDEDELETEGREAEDSDVPGEAACEVESADVIRRFARPRALQHIMLAMRVAICMDEYLPIPEGSRNVSSLALVARSVAVLNSIWQVSGSSERGAFRCAFYNVATLNLCGLAISLSENRKCSDGSILHYFASLGREISNGFHSMLAFNPTLLVDALFFPELSTQRLYASKQYQKETMESGE
jgi:hypothetical protein